jgi:hypothetical protein
VTLEDAVGIGGSIVLIAIGAILAFAVHVSVGWLDLSVVGWVLMAAGLIALLLTMWFWSNRRRVTPVPVEPDRVVDERRRVTPMPVEPDRVVDERRRVEYQPPGADI